MSVNTKVTIAGIEFKNPITTASGTFAAGREFSEFYDLCVLGAVTVKGVANEPWEGNPTPRIAEVYGGMLNSIGLENAGVDHFIREDLPFLKGFDTKIIVNVVGHSEKEYLEVIEKLNDTDIDLMEINISCPNVSEGGISFGTDAKKVEKLVSRFRRVAKKPFSVKLSPNVTDISEIAKAAEAAGADCLSLINSVMGMKIDVYRKKAVLAKKIGGVSGPAIKPIAVRMIYETAKAVKIPIIGMGGVMTGEDAAELIMAGAAMAAVGMANFTNPYAAMNVVEELRAFMEKTNVRDINEIRGIIE